jgi:hypothetical protein
VNNMSTGSRSNFQDLKLVDYENKKYEFLWKIYLSIKVRVIILLKNLQNWLFVAFNRWCYKHSTENKAN